MRHSQSVDLPDSARPISLDSSDASWTILRPQTPSSILNLEPPVSTVSPCQVVTCHFLQHFKVLVTELQTSNLERSYRSRNKKTPNLIIILKCLKIVFVGIYPES
jgi:hypothetical protein